MGRKWPPPFPNDYRRSANVVNSIVGVCEWTAFAFAESWGTNSFMVPQRISCDFLVFCCNHNSRMHHFSKRHGTGKFGHQLRLMQACWWHSDGVQTKLEATQRCSAICRVWPWTLTYQKFLLCISSQGQDLYSHQKLNVCIYWFSSESGYRCRRRRRRRRQRRTPQYNQ